MRKPGTDSRARTARKTAYPDHILHTALLIHVYSFSQPTQGHCPDATPKPAQAGAGVWAHTTSKQQTVLPHLRAGLSRTLSKDS